MNELYVYDGIEVKLTGRTAVKQMKESTISGSGRKEQILVEITPTDPSMESSDCSYPEGRQNPQSRLSDPQIG